MISTTEEIQLILDRQSITDFEDKPMTKKKVKRTAKVAYTAEQKSEIMSALNSGASMNEVSLKFGVSKGSLANWKREASVVSAPTTAKATRTYSRKAPIAIPTPSLAPVQTPVAQGFFGQELPVTVLKDIIISQAARLHQAGLSSF